MLFIVLCIQVIVPVLSEVSLAPPQDVHLEKWLLTWTPGTGDRKITYTVQSQSFADVWRNVSACVQISFNSCNVTKHKADGKHGCVMLRVQAERLGLTSMPVEACGRHGDSCTPEVSLTARPGTLTVHLSRNHSMALEYGDHAKHRVYYGKEGEPLQEYEDAASSVSLHELQEGQRYCIKVQYIYFSQPVGLPSCTQCMIIPESKSVVYMAEVKRTIHILTGKGKPPNTSWHYPGLQQLWHVMRLTTSVSSIQSNPVLCRDVEYDEYPKQKKIIVAVVVVIVLVILIAVIAYILIFQRGKIKQWLQPQYEIPDHFLEPFPEHRHPISTSSPCEERRDVISRFTPDEFRE